MEVDTLQRDSNYDDLQSLLNICQSTSLSKTILNEFIMRMSYTDRGVSSVSTSQCQLDYYSNTYQSVVVND